MTLDVRRAQLWRAMGLGPIYRLRGADAAVAVESTPVAPDRVEHIARLTWTDLPVEVARCRACSLCEKRKQTVFGVGNSNAEWMLIGEAPGAEEDARGEPFVGQAGRLLDNMLASIGLTREGQSPQSVYIANVLKCRPPGNRNPQPEEVAKCEPFLRRQIELIAPALIVVMGRFAAQSLLGTDASIASLRGRPHRINVAGREIPVVVTYHPAYLLRNLVDKAKSWTDLCLAREIMAASV
ncbi:MAG TPA: uracil-DNA glycosylase [Burkholderiaceae bacterium]|nr:uracil-DNA glycosylase [Burkholderiaceae bacterium]